MFLFLPLLSFSLTLTLKKTMLIIGIAGGSGSGKTTVVNKIIQSLPKDSVSLVPQDAYYFDHGHLSLEENLKLILTIRIQLSLNYWWMISIN